MTSNTNYRSPTPTARLADDLETVFMATTARHSFLSSSVVKEVARFGGSIDHMVPPEVAKDLNRLFNSAFPAS